MKKLAWSAFAAAALILISSCGGNPDDGDPNCGNGACDKGEDIIFLTEPLQFKCAQDCPGVCGDSVCNTCFENNANCPQDCNQ